MKINLDSGNTVSLGYDLKKEIIDANKLIGSVHIKDRLKYGVTVPLGYGDVNFKVLFKSLNKVNYKGEYVLQASRVKGINDKLLIKNIWNIWKILYENINYWNGIYWTETYKKYKDFI